MSRNAELPEALEDGVARFGRDRLIPQECAVVEVDDLPDAMVQAFRDLGLFGLSIPEGLLFIFAREWLRWTGNPLLLKPLSMSGRS